ncbi:MAG: hypothetical protein ABSF99_09480 [Anaerolineales bacterium]|jgi:hypothetical protein
MKLHDYLKKPAVAAAVGAVIGLVVGLLWAWLIQPVVWKNVPPAQMGTTYQEDYLRMAVDSYSVHPDNTLALQRYGALGKAGPAILATIKSNPGTLDANALSAFASTVGQGSAIPTPTPASGGPSAKTGTLTSIVIILAAVVLFALVAYGILRYLIPFFRNTPSKEPEGTPSTRDVSGQTEITNYASMEQEPPISKFVTNYVLGDDLYDDSFSIDSPTSGFLGECGIGISETIGVGDPKKVQAFEVWLFDKNDVQTVTKVLMSTHAFNDAATYQRLQAKGEPFMVERGKQVVLETAALQMVATVTDAEYGQGALPEESYFDRLTLEIEVWQKTVPPAQ